MLNNLGFQYYWKILGTPIFIVQNLGQKVELWYIYALHMCIRHARKHSSFSARYLRVVWAVVKVKSHGEGVPGTKVIQYESERLRRKKRAANDFPKVGR